MAKYKLINQNGYSSGIIKLNEIYDESYDAGGCTVAHLVRSWPNDWELVQEEKLPDDWVIKITSENKALLMKYNFLNKCINYDYSMGGYYGNKSNGSWTIPYGSTEISWDQFKRLVLKEESMKEKEIIGYKLKKYYKNCEEAAVRIIDDSGYHKRCTTLKEMDNLCRTDIDFQLNSSAYDKLKQAGVLDLWFEPVYANKTPQIEINGYTAKFFDNYVKFGCAKIGKEFILKIYDIFSNEYWEKSGYKNIESVTIGKGTFTKEQIKEIAEYYISKK